MADNNPKKPIPPASTQRTTMIMVIILLAVAFFVGSQFMRTGAMGTTVTDQLITSEFTQAVEQGRVKSVTYSAGDYTVSGTYFPAATAGSEAAGAFNGAFDSLNALMATEHGEDGIYMHCNGFSQESETLEDQFVFRQGRSRETSYAKDYDRLVELLRHEKEHGNIVWVMGPAFAFDDGARKAMQALIDNGYCHGLLAGNALGTHDLEGALLHTALGQDIYTQQSQPNGHYNHLDVLNKVRRCGSIPKFIEEYHIDNGIIYGCVKNHVPFVLTGSIRDDGPLPEVYANAYEGASAMRELVRKSTTVICLATMLHTIATGNMTPSFRVMPDGSIRPVYLYAVDAAEFVVNKLLDRGSLSATTMVTNVQDFIGKVAGGLGLI